jgi:hypothetical protein
MKFKKNSDGLCPHRLPFSSGGFRGPRKSLLFGSRHACAVGDGHLSRVLYVTGTLQQAGVSEQV